MQIIHLIFIPSGWQHLKNINFFIKALPKEIIVVIEQGGKFQPWCACKFYKSKIKCLCRRIKLHLRKDATNLAHCVLDMNRHCLFVWKTKILHDKKNSHDCSCIMSVHWSTRILWFIFMKNAFSKTSLHVGVWASSGTLNSLLITKI